MADQEPDKKIRKPKLRSPNYPAVSLERAVELLGALFNEYGTHPIPIGMVNRSWGYKDSSGTGNQNVAALKSFNLVSVDGVGDSRRIRITDSGQRVVRNAPDRAKLLREAALAPPIHKEILNHYGESGLPVDDLLIQYLVWDRPEGQRFNPETVRQFVDQFRDTLRYAGVTSDVPVEEEFSVDTQGDGNNVGAPEGSDQEIAVGAYIQWTSGDVDQFNPPRRVRKLTADGHWVFVEGSDTGIPAAEVAVVKAPSTAFHGDHRTASAPIDPLPSQALRKRETIVLAEGALDIEWPAQLCKQSVEDIEAWTDFFVKRLRRSAGVDSGT